MLHRIRRLFRDIMYYARKHPMKVFLLVIMPLITGGVLQKILGVVGIRLPKNMVGGISAGERGGLKDVAGMMGAGGGGIGGSVNGLVSLAKMFV